MNTGLFFSTHTERKASRLLGDIPWIWQKVYSIRIVDYTFKAALIEFVLATWKQHISCKHNIDNDIKL